MARFGEVSGQGVSQNPVLGSDKEHKPNMDKVRAAFREYVQEFRKRAEKGEFTYNPKQGKTSFEKDGLEISIVPDQGSVMFLSNAENTELRDDMATRTELVFW